MVGIGMDAQLRWDDAKWGAKGASPKHTCRVECPKQVVQETAQEIVVQEQKLEREKEQ